MTAHGSAADEPAGRVETAGTPTYEPPRLTLVGNLRDLLGKSGPNFDFTTHIPQKT